MGKVEMTPEVVELVARRFKALAEPARLGLLAELRDGAAHVGDLVEQTGLAQATVSKHLGILHELGFVDREREGMYVRYSIADRDVMKLCDLMCGRIERELSEREKLFGG